MMNRVPLGIIISFVAMWIFMSINNLIGFFTSFVFVVVCIMLDYKPKKIVKILCEFYLDAKNSMANVLLHNSSLKISKLTDNFVMNLTKPFISHKALSWLQSRISDRLVLGIRVSGKAANPHNLAEQSMSYTVFSFFVIAPISLVLGVVLNLAFFILLMMPPLILLLPSIRLRLIGSERKAGMEDEIAFFATYGSIMQTVGKTLYVSILQLVGKKIFPIIENEGRMLNRNVELFGMDQSSALNTLAISHPNTQFRNLLLGYVSIQKSGGDLGQYMERKSEEFFNSTKFRFFRYESHAEMIAETTLILLNILPLLLVMSSFLMAEESLRAITNLSFIIVPSIAAIMIMMTSNIQPKTHDVVGFSRLSIVVGAMSAAITILFIQEMWFVLAVTVLVSSAVNFVILSRQFAEIAMIENALADFLRDITEYRKIGITIPNAVMRISKERTYNKFFDAMLSEISLKIAFGISLSKIIDSTYIRSWHAKVSFFVLGKITESGGGTPQVLEQMTDFSTKLTQAKRDMVGKLKVFTFMAYGSPLLMIWSSQSMQDLLEKIGPEYSSLMNWYESSLVVSSEFLQLVNLLMVISSLCVGLITSKLAYFTMKHTLTIAITSIIAIISVYATPFFPPVT